MRGERQRGHVVVRHAAALESIYDGDGGDRRLFVVRARNRVGPIARGTPRCAKCKAPLPWVVDAGESTFTAETSAWVPVVVDFWAAWCGPCRIISPVLEQLAARHSGRLKVVKVDIDANPALAARHGAQSIPLLVVLSDGREVDRIVGAVPRQVLEARLAPLLAPA